MTPQELRTKYSREKLAAIRKLYDRDVDAWSTTRKEIELDLQCLSTEQGPWPQAEWNARHTQGSERPCLHEDVVTQHINQTVNQIEMNPMGVAATPMGNGANQESADYVENRIRALEYETNAFSAYLQASTDAVRSSVGFWKLETAYSGGFKQKVCIEPVMDPLTIVPGFAKRPDWSDLRRAWEIERMSHEEFREKYPKALRHSFEGLKKDAPQWIDDATVQVCAWWHFEEDERELLKLDGPEGPVQLHADEPEAADLDPTRVLERRTITRKRVLKTILNGVEVLDETEWIDPGDEASDCPPEIPFFIVTGRVKYEKGKRVIESLTRNARIGQLLYDYTISAIQEAIGMTPKVKAWGPEGTFDTSTNWMRLNRDPSAYAEWKPVTDPSSGATLPPPEFITYEPPIQALEIAKQSILQGIQNAVGMATTDTKDRRSKSGKAIEALQEEMSVAAAHYFGSERRQLERQYRVLLRILPLLDQDHPEVAVRDKFGKHEMVPMTPAYYEARHSVAVGTGKLYQTLQDKQEETSSELMKIGDPQVLLAVLPGALRMKGLGEYGEQLAKMIEAIQPPQMQQARDAKNPIPPEAIQAIQQAQQAVQSLNAHAKQLEQQVITLEDERRAKILELESKERISSDDNRTKIEIAEINASVKEDINSLNQQVAAMRHIADILTQRYGIDMQADTASQDRTVDQQTADQDRAASMETADKDREAQPVEAETGAESAADVMGEVHKSQPVTDEDKIISRLHKQHRKELDQIKDPEERARQAIPHNQRHAQEHRTAAEQRRALAAQVPAGAERERLLKSADYHDNHAHTHEQAERKNQEVLASH